jgi:hypothetical protein
VAAALHIFRQAEHKKQKCQLRIRGQRVHWRRIQTYLRKNKIEAEVLLAERRLCDVIPSYITFEFEVDSAATTPSLSTPPAQLTPGPMTSSSCLTPNSSPNLSQATPIASISELKPQPSSNNSSIGKTSEKHDWASGSQNTAFDHTANVSPAVETHQENVPLHFEHDQVGFWAPGGPAGSLPHFPIGVFEQFVGNPDNTSDPPAESINSINLYRLMSLTPPPAADVPSQSMTALGHTGSSFLVQHHMSNNIIESVQQAHAQVQPNTFQPSDYPVHFLSWSIIACLRKNEGMNREAELAMKEASKSFKSMVADRHERCLTSLNLILALLEAHGKRDIAVELLGGLNVATLSLKDIPEKMSVVLTIRFKMDIMCGLERERMSDPAVLREIHCTFERYWGPHSPSTLACLCNLGWRLAGDKDTGRLTEALDVLSRARISLERTLDHHDPQTITCLAMLARVLYNLERPLEGFKVMSTAMERIAIRFPEYHPYRLSALRRFSLFMRKVGSGDPERILREVASRRLRVLGPDCALTQESAKELRDFLMEQGRYPEADDAFRAIAELASGAYCGENISQVF